MQNNQPELQQVNPSFPNLCLYLCDAALMCWPQKVQSSAEVWRIFFQELTVICDDSKWDYLIWTSGLLLAGRPADLDLQAAENMMTARVCGVWPLSRLIDYIHV